MTAARGSPSEPGTAAARLVAVLEANGVTHVVGLPDNSSAAVFDLLARKGAPGLVTVTREGEAFAVAAGIWAGGGQPFVLIQGTGLLESGDALRGTLLRARTPIVMVVTSRGYGLMRRRGIDPAAAGERLPALDPSADRTDLLTDPELDAVGLLTEPTLRAWGIPFRYWGPDQVAEEVLAWAFATSAERQLPAALILTDALRSG